MTDRPRQKIAIIGSGISGLASAYLLSDHHNVSVFEQNATVGGHTRTLKIPIDHNNRFNAIISRKTDHDRSASSEYISVDTGFIVFNKHNYPLLTRLFEYLDVDIQASIMSFSVSSDHGQFEWGSSNLCSFFAQPSNLVKPQMWGMLKDIIRFNRHSLSYVNQHPNSTVQQLIIDLGLGIWFQNYYLMPMAAAIWSCTAQAIQSFPARTLIQFLNNHGLLSLSQQPQWFTVKGGSQSYIDKLTANFADHIRVNTPVARVDRHHNKVIIHMTNKPSEMFDHVIFACHGDQVLPLLNEPSAAEADLFDKFKFQKNRIYLHRDTSQMPRRSGCWSSWNYLTSAIQNNTDLSVTYWMNRLQNLDYRYPLFVTLNPHQSIPDEFIYNVHDFDHPLFDQAAINAQRSIMQIQGQQNTWYCGAYLGYGFHEDGLRSAVNVAHRMGIPLLSAFRDLDLRKDHSNHQSGINGLTPPVKPPNLTGKR